MVMRNAVGVGRFVCEAFLRTDDPRLVWWIDGSNDIIDLEQFLPMMRSLWDWSPEEIRQSKNWSVALRSLLAWHDRYFYDHDTSKLRDEVNKYGDEYARSYEWCWVACASAMAHLCGVSGTDLSEYSRTRTS